jgi:hypothetical protein
MATQANRPMISEVSICNQALSWLGANEITSLDDPSKEAEYCRNNYEFLRDAVLEDYDWTFAQDRQSSEVADLDAWGQKYKHSKPLDWLMVWGVYKDVSSQNPRDWVKCTGWVVEGGFVLADESMVYMRGTKRITDTGKFTNLFVQALAARMACDLAIPMTENRQLQADMWALYNQKLELAAMRDGKQGHREKLTQGSLVKARRR